MRPVEQPEIAALKFPGVTVICLRNMASVSGVAAAAAAAAAAANRDPAVDRSLRSVFGKFIEIFYPGFINAFLLYESFTNNSATS